MSAQHGGVAATLPPFSGSYALEDVQFLLRRLAARPYVDIARKEALIQSCQCHYSDMLSPETLPPLPYAQLFAHACAANLPRMAHDCLRLAGMIAARRAQGPITLVSLARAGTPVGVVLRRLLVQRYGRAVQHYGVSIVRDRGIDAAALRHVLAQGHAPESIVFVDGWTGKGVITRALAHSVAAFNGAQFGGAAHIDAGLHVLSDLAGAAACASADGDYLIPSCLLNATVSGLISRTVVGAADDFHGCVFYEEFAAHDQSRWTADALTAAALAQPLPARASSGYAAHAGARAAAAATSRACLARLQQHYGVADANLVKPGIGEATRVLLRRVPRLLLLRAPGMADVRHLQWLAQEKQVPVVIDPALPYRAVSLIRSAQDA